MKFTAIQIAEIVEGDIIGNPKAEVFKLSKIEEGEEGSLTFLSNPKYTPFIYKTKASVVIVNKSFTLEKETSITLIKVEDAYQSFSKLLCFYNDVKSKKIGIETPNFIEDTVKIGKDVYIGAFTYIGKNVKIGNNVKVYPNVFLGDNVVIKDNVTIYSGTKIYYDTEIGLNCNIDSNVVIGADGFGFSPDEKGIYSKVPQIGNVIIEDNVDIGSSTTIDRATMGSTIIRKGVKLDNQIQIAHNVEIGENTVIAAQTGIAGSTKIGKNCLIGGQVGIVGHITIGDNVRIQAQSGIAKNIKDNKVVQGTPAFGYNDFNKSYVYFKKLPDLANTVNKLEQKIKDLTEKLKNNE